MTTTGTGKPLALPITVPPRPEALWPERMDGTKTRRIHALTLLAIAVGTGYVIWRLAATLSPASIALGIPLVLLEAWSVVALAMTAFVLWDVDSVDRPEPVLETEAAVVVLIPTVDEPFHILLPTLTAAARMRLATRVVVLDDANRGWLASMCYELGVEYRSRLRHLGGRAGQLNDALASLEGDYVVVLEPDQVATRDFIGSVLPHFEDPGMALVQTPRDTFSMDSFEHVQMGRRRLSETALRDRLMSAGRNRWNAAFWGGGAAMLRLSALNEVGGVAPGEAAAGIRTSIRLHSAGWKSVQHNEVLARGVAAADAADYREKTRVAGRAKLSALRSEHFILGRGLSLAQRVSYLQATTTPLSSWRLLGYLVLPALALLFAVSPVSGSAALFAGLLAVSYALRGVAYSALKRDRTPHYLIDPLAMIRFTALLGTVRSLILGDEPALASGLNSDAPRRVPAILWVLGALNVAALVWALLVGTGIADVQYPFAIVAFGACIWVLVNLTLVASAVSRVRSSVFGGERRLAQRVEVEGHVFVDGQRVHVLDLSLTGIRALTYANAPEVGEYCSVTFMDQNHRPAVVTGTVVGTTPRPQGTELRVGLEPEQTYVISAILADAFIRRD